MHSAAELSEARQWIRTPEEGSKMVIYRIVVCNHCEHPVITDHKRIEVVVWDENDVEKALALLKSGKSLKEVSNAFCPYCLKYRGNEDCACDIGQEIEAERSDESKNSQG